MSAQPITIFHGSLAEALVLRGRLEANGVAALLCDENTKIIDPFITGADALSVDLQVSSEAASEAGRILRDRERVPGEESAQQAELRKLADRIRWASLVTIGAPVAIHLFLFRFVPLSRRLGWRPEGHVFTLGAVAYSLVVILLALALWVPAVGGWSTGSAG